ncbi:MAG: sulfurtransferase-like selenium metabolism protein YedF [Eubacteriales bacterium]|nr:sulfurtransferase-like selenium metabolism protein YedF [Eubacteriales bacterium]MDY3332289.1 sulfurtransferase-like selenium metabolism protein YedF [Gallibacter sp.]
MKNLDAVGKACPLPVIEAKQALSDPSTTDGINIKVDNDTAVFNLGKLATSLGYTSSNKKLADNLFEVTIMKNADASNTSDDEESQTIQETVSHKKITTIVIEGDVMGKGDEVLGKNLLKGFIFALSKRDVMPDNIIFYNKGAYVSSTESETIDDLKSMEARGVNIITCGACLDFYKLKEELKVGNVSNMYDILETMANSDLIIKP